MKKQIILLNGPSSSGKSTLAKALQERILNKKGERFAIVSIDDHMKLSTSETIYEDDVFDISREMCDAVLRSVAQTDGVIVDHVITSKRIFRQFMDAVGEYPTCLVQVTCPVEVLRERERSRGDRCIGSAEASFEYLFPQAGYTITVDTYGMRPKECAQVIMDILA